MKIPPPAQDMTETDLELAKLRADVAKALSADKPDAAVLTAALERVDAMLHAAQADLAAALHELVEQLRGRSQLQPAHFASAWSLIQPTPFRH